MQRDVRTQLITVQTTDQTTGTPPGVACLNSTSTRLRVGELIQLRWPDPGGRSVVGWPGRWGPWQWYRAGEIQGGALQVTAEAGVSTGQPMLLTGIRASLPDTTDGH